MRFRFNLSRLSVKKMSIKIKFPGEVDTLRQYTNKEEFKQQLRKYCMEKFDQQKAFEYTVNEKRNNQRHYWKCNSCKASIEYEKNQKENVYVRVRELGDQGVHLHKASAFENFNQKKLGDFLGDFKSFDFPNCLDDFQKFGTKEEILRKYKFQWQVEHSGLATCTSEAESQTNTLLLQCKYKDIEFLGHSCPWRALYKLDEDSNIWVLSRSTPTHEHHFVLEKHVMSSKEQQAVLQVMGAERQENQSIKVQDDKNNKTQRTYVTKLIDEYEKVFKEPKRPLYETLDMLLRSLKRQKMELRYKHKTELQNADECTEDDEDLVIVSSKMMKFMGKSYGKVIYVTQQPITQNEQNRDQFAVLTFYGFNHSYQLVVFGFGMVRNLNTSKGINVIEQMRVRYFINLETIIVHEEESLLVDVINNYPKEWKSFNVCIKSSLGLQPHSQPIFDHESKSFNQVLLDNYSHILSTSKPGQLQAVQNKIDKMFGNQTSFFLGLDFELENFQVEQRVYADKSNATLSNLVTFEYEVFRVVKEAQKINQSWFKGERERTKFEAVFSFRDDLRKCRLMMAKKPFAFLMKQMMKMCSVSITAQSPSFYVVSDHIYPYIVTKKAQQWQCECNVVVRTGIPCPHLLKVLYVQKLNLFDGVNLYWIMDQAIVNLEPNPEKANSPYIPKRKRRLGRRKLIA